MVYQPSRNNVRRNTIAKTNDVNKSNDNDLELGTSDPAYQIIFLLESTSNDTKYIDVYKDAVNDQLNNDGDNGACTEIVIDCDKLIDSLDGPTVRGKETLRGLRERVKSCLNVSDQNCTEPMVQLVRYTVIKALKSCKPRDTKNDGTAAIVNVVLTGFLDLKFITRFLDLKLNVTAIVKISCKQIARTREKFVTSVFKARQSVVNAVIRQFWSDFHDGLETAKTAILFKDVVFYCYKSKYNAQYEPPDYDKIVKMSRKYAMREMAEVQNFISNVKANYEKYVKNIDPITHPLISVKEHYTNYYTVYNERLSKYPVEVINVPVVLDAIIEAIGSPTEQPKQEWVNVYMNKLKDSNYYEDGWNYPVCTQFGNECGLMVKKHDLRGTNYSRSVIHMLDVRWRRLLWGSRPLRSLEIEDEYTRVINNVKSRCENDNDIDLQLCVLGLNRLCSNLDVYRGENIDFHGLTATRVTFKPEFMEPVSCTVMLQMLEKQSENYKQLSYAYFEPEDVMLVGFYDFPKIAPTRKLLYNFNVPQRPVYTKDYFDFIGDKKMPKCVYDMNADLCSTYNEETLETCFPNHDCLTVSKRKWRFERDTVSLFYRSKRYAIIRHVTADGTDGFTIQIYGTGVQYRIDKKRENVKFEGKTADGTTIVSRSGTRFQQSTANTTRESFRRYGNGRVAVRNAVGSEIIYSVDGKATVNSGKQSDTSVSRKRSNDGRSMAAINKQRTLSARSTVRRGDMKQVRSMARRPPPTPKSENSPRDAPSFPNFKYNSDGTSAVVRFADGTEIVTHVREEPVDQLPDWTCFAIFKYEFRHPEYRTVTETVSESIGVSGIVSRSPDGPITITLDLHTRLQVVGDKINVSGDAHERPKTFYWSDSDILFESRDANHGNVTVYKDRADFAVASRPQSFSKADSASYFIVKRNMSGFRVLDRSRYEKFMDKIRRGTRTAIRENQHEVVTWFDQGEEDNSMKNNDSPLAVKKSGYAWYEVFSRKPKPVTNTIPKLLVSRAFEKFDADYDSTLNALRNNACAHCATAFEPQTAIRPTKLVVRKIIPNIDDIKAMYEKRIVLQNDLRDENLIKKRLNIKVKLSEKRARLIETKKNALEALWRMRSNCFIPYFERDKYNPLKIHFLESVYSPLKNTA